MSTEEEENEASRLHKIVVVGDPTVGKTSIINRYIGVDFALKELEKNNKKIRLQLWDIAGQERYNTLTHIYYRNAVGVIVVFDVCQKDTFQNVRHWKKDIDSKVFLNEGEEEMVGVPTILLANKVDMEDNLDKSVFEDLDDYCKDRGFLKWFKTSAKTGEGIEEALEFLVGEIEKALETVSQETDPEVFSLEKESKKSTNSQNSGGGNNCPC